MKNSQWNLPLVSKPEFRMYEMRIHPSFQSMLKNHSLRSLVQSFTTLTVLKVSLNTQTKYPLL